MNHWIIRIASAINLQICICREKREIFESFEFKYLEGSYHCYQRRQEKRLDDFNSRLNVASKKLDNGTDSIDLHAGTTS